MTASEIIFSAQIAIELAVKSLSAAFWHRQLTELSESSSSDAVTEARGQAALGYIGGGVAPEARCDDE
ncbi:hypothetical protein E4U33_006250, partial [Claviceps sp. LM78 group G4]